MVVAHDARFETPPEWLRSWEKLEDLLYTDDWFAFPRDRVLYKKAFPAGTITLGGNRDLSMPLGLSMYSVILVSGGYKPDTNAVGSHWRLFQ